MEVFARRSVLIMLYGYMVIYGAENGEYSNVMKMRPTPHTHTRTYKSYNNHTTVPTGLRTQTTGIIYG